MTPEEFEKYCNDVRESAALFAESMVKACQEVTEAMNEFARVMSEIDWSKKDGLE